MARLALNCRCGWNFFIPESTQGSEVSCPSCGQEVRIPGRRPGQEVLSPGMLAAKKNQQALTLKLVIGVLAAIVVVGLILVFVLSSREAPPPAEADVPRGPRRGFQAPVNPTPTNPESSDAPGENPSGNPKTPRPANPPGVDVGDLKRKTDEAIVTLNVMGVVSEVLRLTGRYDAQLSVQGQMAQVNANKELYLRQLAQARETHNVDAHLMPGDQIVSFAQQELANKRPLDQAALLDGWLQKLGTNLPIEQCIVLRGNARVPVYLLVKDATKEILLLSKRPQIEPGQVAIPNTLPPAPGGDAPPLDPDAFVAIPPEILQKIPAVLSGLPPGSLNALFEDDRQRMEMLLQRKTGNGRDVEFLKTRILGDLLPRLEQELALFRSKSLELEPKARVPSAVDVVKLKDGRTLIGKIINETEEGFQLQGQYGSTPIRKEDVLSLGRGKGPGVQFLDKLKAAQGKPAELLSLMLWCKENNLRLQKEYVGYLVLSGDLASERARAELGLPRPLAGVAKGAAADPAANNEAVMKSVDAIASDVVKRFPLFTDLLAEMRNQTSLLRYTEPFLFPERFQRTQSLIGNPLTFRPNALTVQTSMELGGWWGQLTPDDRREFAKWFGLWCAYTRATTPPPPLPKK
jgi:hypothetical protein